MLNELYQLHQSLERCNLSVPQSHSWVQPLTTGKGQPFFIVGIKENGDLGSLEYRDASEMKRFWQIKESNHSRFPAFEIHAPLWGISSEIYIKSIFSEKNQVSRWNQIEKLIKVLAPAYDKKQLITLSNKLNGLPTKIYDRLSASQDNLLVLMHSRLQKRNNIDDNALRFISSITRLVIENVKSGNFSADALDLAEKLLLGKWDNKNKELQSVNIPVIIDFDDYTAIGQRIYSEKNKFDTIKCLAETEIQDDNGIDSLTGNTASLISKAPQPTLPLIGPTYLMSMNKHADCHYRYGAVSTDIFPVGNDTVEKLNNAINFITKSERRSLTWNDVPNPQPKKKDLLIVYLEDMPNSQIKLASIFSHATEEEDSVGIFEKTTKSVCDALRGEPSLTKNSSLRIFVISQVDPGRKRIVANSLFTVDGILQGAESWKAGTKNIPAFSLSIKLEGAVVPVSPWMPSPAEAMEIFKSQWIRNGQDKSEVGGVALTEIYNIYVLGSSRQMVIAEKLLKLLLTRATPLLVGLGGATRNQQWKSYSDGARWHCLRTISMIGILLDKLNITKEKYMNDVPFNVGRMLALADTLHFQYCTCVRDGKMPLQLIGNSLMAIALGNPERAISVLGERLRIYLAWATTVIKAGNDEKKNKAIGLAHWVLGQYGKTANILKKYDIPQKATDTDRAQILLGYLAREEKTE